MKDLTAKIQEVYEAFAKDAALQVEKTTRQLARVPVSHRWQ